MDRIDVQTVVDGNVRTFTFIAERLVSVQMWDGGRAAIHLQGGIYRGRNVTVALFRQAESIIGYQAEHDTP